MSCTSAFAFAPGRLRNASIFIAHVCAISCKVSHASAIRLFAFVFSFAPERVTKTLRCDININDKLAFASSTVSPSAFSPKIGTIYALATSASARSIIAWSI